MSDTSGDLGPATTTRLTVSLAGSSEGLPRDDVRPRTGPGPLRGLAGGFTWLSTWPLPVIPGPPTILMLGPAPLPLRMARTRSTERLPRDLSRTRTGTVTARSHLVCRVAGAIGRRKPRQLPCSQGSSEAPSWPTWPPPRPVARAVPRGTRAQGHQWRRLRPPIPSRASPSLDRSLPAATKTGQVCRSRSLPGTRSSKDALVTT